MHHILKKDIGKVANIKNTLYLCNVFFIVLDLRLTKGWDSAEPLFLYPYVNQPLLNTQHFPHHIFSYTHIFYFSHSLFSMSLHILSWRHSIKVLKNGRK